MLCHFDILAEFFQLNSNLDTVNRLRLVEIPSRKVDYILAHV